MRNLQKSNLRIVESESIASNSTAFTSIGKVNSILILISIQFSSKKRIIGHGAFGEVFEGWLLLPDANANGQNDGGGQKPTAPIKVAVKSLPVESAHDFGDDFEMEARLLSQFKHQNIVTFFGVSFEQQPKYIVLEFLEGGDLKNFLRENRPRQVNEWGFYGRREIKIKKALKGH